ncbi:MAG: hypothetical protein GOV15_03285, partial [Candidatus Diapherotrites archaeon]|nr:hypothetical protein [Candidatus Diapherotrites archaeon]
MADDDLLEIEDLSETGKTVEYDPEKVSSIVSRMRLKEEKAGISREKVGGEMGTLRSRISKGGVSEMKIS